MTLMMTNHTTAVYFTEQQIGSKDFSDKMYNGCLKHATKLIPEKDGQEKDMATNPPKWRWPQKRYGTPEKPSLKS